MQSRDGSGGTSGSCLRRPCLFLAHSELEPSCAQMSPRQFPDRLRVFSLPVLLLTSTALLSHSTMAELWRCDFEVFGRVQGVFFRKYTQGKAHELGVKGWCQNTPKGTVVGTIEGEKRSYNMMKDWLSRVGSPQSAIDKAVFREEKQIPHFSFNEFSIKR